MSGLDSKFLKELGDAWEPATEGFVLQAHSRGKKIIDVAVGETYEYYDWASLTKIVFTVSSLMMSFDKGDFKLNDHVSKWVEWFPENARHRVRDLLSHSAGLTWWYPFWKDLLKATDNKTTPEESWQIFQGLLRKLVLKDLKKSTGPIPAEKAVYSDLDFFMLGIILENISGANLNAIWDETAERMGLQETNFLRGNKPKVARSNYARTENCVFRGQLQGEVHDQNTWALRGVAPHAGLFGPIDDLSRYGLLLRNAMQGQNSKKFATAATVQRFTKRAIPREKGDWALGFTMPSKGAASCGPRFSPQSVGHLGFAGTSLWYDPKQDLLVTILSNRIYPTVENNEIKKLRPLVHTIIADLASGRI